MLDREYEDKLYGMDSEDINNDTTAKSIVSTGESAHKIEKSLGRIETSISDLKDLNGKGKKDKKREIDSMQIDGVRFRVIEYNSSYVGDLGVATDIYHAQKMGMKLRSLEVDLNQGAVTMESDMFQSSEGEVELEQKLNPMHMLKGLVRKMNDESFFRPEFVGTGIVRLRSDFKFVQLIHVPKNTRLVLEKGIYLASAGEWKEATAKNFNVGMVVFSEKSLLQTELRGRGLVALELPVHPTELIKHVVTPDRPFKVSGEHVLYWAGNLKRKINPAKKLLGNMASGRGVVEEYTIDKGEGYVYTAPTMGYYSKLAEGMEGKNTSNTDPIREDTDLGKHDRGLKDLFGFRTGISKAIWVVIIIIVVYVLIKIMF